MKRLFKFIFIFLIILLPFNIFAENTDFIDQYNSEGIIRASSGEFELLIDDSADILTAEEENRLEKDMTKLLEYGNILFVSENVEINDAYSAAVAYYYKNFGYENGTIFYINMKSRYIYIYSEGDNGKILTKMKSNIITDNVYKYASIEKYYECASEAFSQIYTVLNGGKIAQPLRYICSMIIALISSFMVCFIYAYFSSQNKETRINDLINSVDAKLNVNNFNAVITGEDKVYIPPSSSSSGSSFRGRSGGGGFSGGRIGRGSGGGHRF